MNNQVTITKEKVVETAKLGTIANDIMRKLFPQCFEPKFNLTDRVKVIDGSNNKDVNTGKKRHGVDPLFENNTAVVIENNLYIDTYSDCYYQNKGLNWQFSDIMLLFPDGTKVYTNSSLCDKA